MPPPADFEALLRIFASANVEFVVIGGVSAALQGVPAVTYDLDLVLDPDAANLDRAHDVLTQLGAFVREAMSDRHLAPRRKDLESPGAILLSTQLGPLDLLGRVATGGGYAEIRDRAMSVRIADDLEIHALDLAALIEVKEAVGREKDRAVLPLYRSTLNARETREGD